MAPAGVQVLALDVDVGGESPGSTRLSLTMGVCRRLAVMFSSAPFIMVKVPPLLVSCSRIAEGAHLTRSGKARPRYLL